MSEVSPFGQTSAGAQVDGIMLRSETLAVRLLTLGCVLQSVRLAGVDYDLTIGSDSVADYEGAMGYHGSIIAPVVNRLTNGMAPVGGKMVQFEKNVLGRHTLHSGAVGVQHKIWKILRASEKQAVLTLDLPDGEGGFAGNRHVQASFTLQGDTLRLDVSATTDRATLWNAANHSYWNLDGSADFSGHSLQIDADHILPLTADFVPSGQIEAVGGSAYDFRSLRTLSPQNPSLDTNFCLNGADNFRHVITLRGQSGVTLRVSTSEGGAQIYDCRHDGYRGLAIEAQNWPDAPNHATFPNIELDAGQSRVQSTAWQFSKE
jgi:aldose 1-epimerase